MGALGLSEAEEAELHRLLEEQAQHEAENKLFTMYPDTGPLRRELYAKHLIHFRAGATHNERALMGGNRSGKSVACTYEHTLHLTGLYPDWWEGFRFDRPITGWASGEDSKSVRESLQIGFLGKMEQMGTGMIPKANVTGWPTRPGVADAIDTVLVKHTSGGISRLVLKSYDQGREASQAAQVDVIHFDK